MGIFDAMPPRGGPSVLAVDFNVEAGYDALSNGRSLSGAGDFGVTFYPRRPVVDDDAPLSLQPFLQRASTVRVGMGVAGFNTVTAAGFTRNDDREYASASADVYVFDALSLAGSASIQREDVRDTFATDSRSETVVGASLAAGAALRLGTLRIDAGYRLPTLYLSASPAHPPPGRFYAGVRFVAARRFSISASVRTIDEGAAGSLTLGYYPARRYGVVTTAFMSRGAPFVDTSTVYSTYGGTVGGSYWVTNGVNVGASYSSTWRVATSVTLEHTLDLSVVIRVR